MDFTERSFALGEIPVVLWTPEDAAAPPLILMGHGGGQSKNHPGIVNRARRFAAAGFTVAAIDAPNHGDRPRTPEFESLLAAVRAGEATFDDMHDALAGPVAADWAAVLDAMPAAGPVGYWGMSMGCGVGVPFIAGEPRVAAAVLGLFGSPSLTATAAKITVPVLFLAQWDDQLVPRADSLALFDALASPAKSLHANPGGHGDLPRFETDGALAFFSRHLM
jgi:dienelactone hydrolase